MPDRYTYTSIFANQLVEAASLTSYWELATIWRTLGLYVLAPLVIILLNLCGVKVGHLLRSMAALKGIDELVLWICRICRGFSQDPSRNWNGACNVCYCWARYDIRISRKTLIYPLTASIEGRGSPAGGKSFCKEIWSCG